MPENRNYSPHQQKIIKRFYDNRDQLDEQHLAELCGNLYLATGKKRAKLWESAQEIMTRLDVPPSRVDHIIKSGDPALVAEVVKDIQSGKIQKKPKPPGGSPASSSEK